MTLSAAGLVGLADAARADITGSWAATGTRMSNWDRAELRRIKAEAAANAAATGLRHEYASVANCGTNNPASPNPDDLCTDAARYCAGNPPGQGLGPSVRLFRRAVNASGQPTGPWEQYGITCFPEDAPGARPGVTMAMVLAAFHDTAFAKPTLEVQPKGNVTLVTLPTYFETRWPGTGFEPGEVDHVDPARMAGFRVEIRPRLKSVVYLYGDGTSSGPTTSLGGPYPTGDITKSYSRAGDFTIRAAATYTGEFRVNGGEWIDIPGNVTIQGTPETLQVKTAKARLYTR
ncbi:hypothetical protein BJ986_001662 [Phycicoccus badiiscoriae]|uniref:Uncharacterized protein n=1 Tax=Pedococcus badiiscoriae TaxID=642776 RepID=A0A852WLT2_9MICO|nr:hypothetical protein [Pedococcus badiiscoriae]NYG07175.1 hypothetical protein [Pedococcus badiiscoriae]